MDKMYSTKYSNKIIRDRYLLIIDNKNNRKLCTVNKGTVRIGKLEINLNEFENKQINTFWQIDQQPYVQISHKDFSEADIVIDEEEITPEDNGNAKILKNNREIFSLGSQKLNHDEIMELRNQGVRGDELIKVLMENNTSTEKRTVYSQEKIIKKKKAKYLNKVWIADTNIFNITETIFLENEKRINYMRMDTFGTMLAHSIFSKNANTLLYEDIENILISVYAARSSFESNLVSLFNGKITNKNLAIFNQKRKTKYIISHINSDYFINTESSHYKFMMNRYSLYFENLVFCIKNMSDIILLTTQLWGYLKNSGVLIVYSRELEFLVCLEKFLFENKLALDVKIVETYLREYQVLSGRTHPMMNNKGFSGYVLSAIKFKYD